MVPLVGNNLLEVNLANTQKKITTGVTGVGEFVEMCDGTQEVHLLLNGTEYYRSSEPHKSDRTSMWKSESIIVALKRVMIVERRVGK
jgi:hypothetical protein